jgi:hypothetical protein
LQVKKGMKCAQDGMKCTSGGMNDIAKNVLPLMSIRQNDDFRNER